MEIYWGESEVGVEVEARPKSTRVQWPIFHMHTHTTQMQLLRSARCASPPSQPFIVIIVIIIIRPSIGVN